MDVIGKQRFFIKVVKFLSCVSFLGRTEVMELFISLMLSKSKRLYFKKKRFIYKQMILPLILEKMHPIKLI